MAKEINPFRFKQFMVYHDRATMKVGTDAVLLGAWVDTSGVDTALDIGTGSGIIALMLAQRTAPYARIDAVEADPKSVLDADENIACSPWPKKIITHPVAIQEFCPQHQYDLVVSNPPYFVNSLLPPTANRQEARHTKSLSYEALLKAAQRLLRPTGKFAVILPTKEGDQFQITAKEYGFNCSRRLAFYTRTHKPQERWLLEFVFDQVEPATEKLILYDKGNEWTQGYRALTGDFYLSAQA